MSDPSLPNDELHALIAEERAALSDPGPARARLAARLAAELAAAPTPAPAPSPRPGAPRVPRGLSAGVLAFATGVAVGALGHGLLTPEPRVEVRYVERVVEVERPAMESAPEPVAPPVQPEKAPPSPPAKTRAERTRDNGGSEKRGDAELARERLLMDRARSALARGDAPGALSALEEHARSFARGQLVEAREALAVQALVSAGRHDEARARAERFQRKFPGSPYAPVVEAALEKIP